MTNINMHPSLESIASNPGFFLTLVVVLGATSQWLAWRFRIPSILLLLGFGLALRQLTGVDPSDVLGEELLFSLVSIFVAVILFEGGLSLKLVEVRESKSVVAKLVLVGVLITWVLSAFAASLLLGMDWRIATLIGAVLTVTGPTVVGPLLRHIRPSRRVASITKWEGIVVDPVGALLAVLVFEAMFAVSLSGGESPGAVGIALLLTKTLVVGGIVAFAGAKGLTYAVRRYWIPDHLHNLVFLAVALAAFAISNAISHESGLVTVTLLGILLANQGAFPVRHVLQFKENLRDLLISTLFIVLSARIAVEQIIDLGWEGLAFVALLIMVIRPIAVYVSCVGSRLRWQERTFLAFLAPRGIVAAAVATAFAAEIMSLVSPPVGSASIVPLTFLVIVGTVTTYGLLSPVIARWLKLATPNPQGILFVGASTPVRRIAAEVHAEGLPVLLIDTNFQHVSAARQEGLPAICASVLSEFIAEEVDLSELGYLLAMTPNDDLNRLATVEFATDFGRAHVFQTAPRTSLTQRRTSPKPHIEGRTLFGREWEYGQLKSLIANGATVKRTKITRAFTYAQYQERYGTQATELFVISPGGELQIVGTEPVHPQPGTILVSLVKPSPASHPTNAPIHTPAVRYEHEAAAIATS